MQLAFLATIALVVAVQGSTSQEAHTTPDAPTGVSRTLRGGGDTHPDMMGANSTNNEYSPEPAYTSHYISTKEKLLNRDYGNVDDPDKAADPNKDLLSLVPFPNLCKDGLYVLHANSWESSLYDGYATYPNNLYKCWILDAGPGNTVNLRIIQTSIETGYDHLKAYDITGYVKHIPLFFGKSWIRTYTGYSSSHPSAKSSGRYMLLEFKTDYSVQAGGFYARYKEYQTSFSRCFYNIGTGYCRDSNGGAGTYTVRCTPGPNSCSVSTCKFYCRTTNKCSGIEYRGGRCEVHTGGVTTVSYSQGSTCYTYEYCD